MLLAQLNEVVWCLECVFDDRSHTRNQQEVAVGTLDNEFVSPSRPKEQQHHRCSNSRQWCVPQHLSESVSVRLLTLSFRRTGKEESSGAKGGPRDTA